MPDAIITSTASTFGTISGTFAADQSTITGTVTGGITGTISGSVGIPGPVGPAGPGSTWGGIAGVISNQVDLWSELGSKYPLTGNPSGFITSSALSPYLTSATAASTYQTLAGMSSYLTTAAAAAGYYPLTGNPSGFLTAASLSGYATESWVTGQGYITSAALAGYAPLASPVFTGDARAVTAALGDNDTSIATTAFVQQELLSGTANARNLEVYVRNQTGSTIPAGSIVYINGATGNRPTITLAQANNDANSAQTIGFVKTSIANNGTGFVIVRGELENIDTSALTEGVQLYLSPTTAGAWTTTKPSAPQHLVYVGFVVRAHPTQGVILVAVQNGYELNELHDVQIVSPTNGQVLKYDAATNLWKNGTDVGGVAWGGITGTLSAQTDLQTALDGKYPLTGNPSGFITSSALTGYATESWVTAGFYPLTGNPSGFITSSALTPYLTSATASATYQTLSGMSAYLTTSAAASTYYPLTGNPSGFITSAALSTYAPLASPALTGNVSIVSNSTGAALFIEQAGTGNILTLHDQAADTNFVAIDANGKVSTIPSVAGGAGFNIAHGTAPTSPVNGDIWTTTSGLFMRQNGSTQQYVDFGGTQTISGAKTFSNANQTLGNSTADGTINVGTGATISGSTKAVNIGTNGVAGSTTNIAIGSATSTTTTTVEGTVTLNGTALNLGNSTAASQINLGTGSTISGATKTIQIGSFAASGSTTNVGIANSLSPPSAGGTITIGTSGQTTTNLNGTVNATTASAGTSTTQIATTAFVTTADNLKANLASPTFTGTPLSTTAAADTNTTQIATTAYVVGQAGSATPLVNGTAAVGTSLRYARQDHVHGTDTTRAPLNSPAFTGTPSLPTGTTAVTQTAGNNTTAVATTAFVQQEVPAASTTAAGKVELATNAEVITSTATNLAIVPASLPFAITDPRLRSMAHISYTKVSGSGAVSSGNVAFGIREMYLGSLATGLAGFSYGWTGQIAVNMSSSDWTRVNFSKKIWMSGVAMCGATIGGTNYIGDSNTRNRITLGGYTTDITSGDMTVKGIGWKKVGGTSSFFTLTVHNGTTLTDVASTITQSAGKVISWMIYSDGTGNVTLYIDGVQSATTSAGPTGTSNANQATYREQVEAVATPTVRGIMECSGGAIYIEP